jgi:hypothetical protein
LKADLAFLHFSRQNYAKASEIFGEICFTYSESGWNHIDTVLMERYSICQRQLGKNKDLIRCYLHLAQYPQHLILETAEFYLDQLINSCKVMNEPYKTQNNSMFQLKSMRVYDELDDTENVLAYCTLHSQIPKEMVFESAIISFTAGIGLSFELNLDNFILSPGVNQLIFKAAVFLFFIN